MTLSHVVFVHHPVCNTQQRDQTLKCYRTERQTEYRYVCHAGGRISSLHFTRSLVTERFWYRLLLLISIITLRHV